MEIFSHLRDTSKGVAELSELADCDRKGLSVMLESLCSFGFLERQKELYQIPRSMRKWLTPDASKKGSSPDSQYILD
jgi:DNA-binding IclR family transcriptional regulator